MRITKKPLQATTVDHANLVDEQDRCTSVIQNAAFYYVSEGVERFCSC